MRQHVAVPLRPDVEDGQGVVVLVRPAKFVEPAQVLVLQRLEEGRLELLVDYQRVLPQVDALKGMRQRFLPSVKERLRSNSPSRGTKC